ncbi:hypothetical protein DL766_007152 [Monosporascus sp. MC13-8B]|uniref:Ubiquitin 3 binding protein But2 C-terminal domain-containing protein n=1 Tax=Monosporascus cannonballus TaxID=155416 RepID=A0ABY0GYG4_9PEZI|nr:hypothetical protein DL762_007663 [Monosporascus cannonballus]RYP00336.1 hypothetical protein DL763_000947 [Monosporascus cannonballus]RYP25059.1 hypothetical protein DL766_007152 [Monosporascus sp. MC13-8B]
MWGLTFFGTSGSDSVSTLSTALASAASAVPAPAGLRADLAITAPDGTCLVGIGGAFNITWSPPGDGSGKVTVGLAGTCAPLTCRWQICVVFSNPLLARPGDINNVGIVQWDVETARPDGGAWTCPEAWFSMPE